MNIPLELKDKHGNIIVLGQRVSLRVYRRSGSYGSWWRRCNENHFKYFWIPGSVEFDAERLNLWFKPDKESEKALEQPMGNERTTQCVDHINIDLTVNLNIDSVNIPAPGCFMEEPMAHEEGKNG